MKRESVNRSDYKYIKYDTVKLHLCMMIQQNLPEPTAGIAGSTAGSFTTLADAKVVAEEELSTGIDVELTAVAVASPVGDTFDTSIEDMGAPVAVIVA